MNMSTKLGYAHQKIEKKWQDKWLKTGIYSPNIKLSKKPFYNLWMFPYPSAEGLHAGHAFASTGSDVIGRFMRMSGKDVFQPIGYDSFGIHSENFAIKTNQTPQQMLQKTTKHYEEQLKSLGHGYDWTRTVTTSNLDYYTWTEWVFREMFKAGLAYRKKSSVNFCPKDKTVLADEQVMSPKQAGKEPIDAKGNPVPDREGLLVCERCGTVVEKRELDVWFFRITDYSQRLLDNLDKIDWSERVSIAQREWIGRSDGMTIRFEKENGSSFEVFTTRPDTLNGVTFIVTSDEKFYQEHANQKEKHGEFTGEYAINPLTKTRIPIWKANYVAPGYGTGMVMGVPGHDKRDFEFAKKYGIDVIKKAPDKKLWKKIETEGWGEKKINYHLRDWGIGRQRYWGCPIPMIYCTRCANNGEGWIALNEKNLIHKDQNDWEWQGWWPEENLPVELPKIKDYKPEGNGRGPLANHPEFYEVKCPHCGADAKRETDVADTFLDSSWYFLRYPSADYSKGPWDEKLTKRWLPVNLYFGGAEHAVLHLMYARFITMVFKDLKQIDFEEPFPKFFAHGLMIKDGAKMSKSRGNVVNPDEYVKKFGADTLRLYVMFMGPMDGSPDFRDTGIEGMHRFVKRVWSLFVDSNKNPHSDHDLKVVMHKTIKRVTEDIKVFHYNTAIAGIMECVNYLKENGSDKESFEVLCKLLAPFAPHLAEELWVNVLGNKYSVHISEWPQFDPRYLKETEVNIAIQIDGKTRSQIMVKSEDSKVEDKVKVLAMNDSKVQKWINGRKYKTIFVPNRIINFVLAKD